MNTHICICLIAQEIQIYRDQKWCSIVAVEEKRKKRKELA